MDKNGDKYQHAVHLAEGAQRHQDAHPDVFLVQVGQYRRQQESDHVNVQQGQPGMQEGHVFKGEEESRQHRGFPGKFEFAADEIEDNDAEGAEDYRKEPPPESCIRKNVNLLSLHVGDDSRAAGAALDGDVV